MKVTSSQVPYHDLYQAMKMFIPGLFLGLKHLRYNWSAFLVSRISAGAFYEKSFCISVRNSLVITMFVHNHEADRLCWCRCEWELTLFIFISAYCNPNYAYDDCVSDPSATWYNWEPQITQQYRTTDICCCHSKTLSEMDRYTTMMEFGDSAFWSNTDLQSVCSFSLTNITNITLH